VYVEVCKVLYRADDTAMSYVVLIEVNIQFNLMMDKNMC